MAEVALGEVRLTGLDGPKEAGSDARPYSYPSQFGACFMWLLMVAGEGGGEKGKSNNVGLRELFRKGVSRSQTWD
jgi:hypothetical protein